MIESGCDALAHGVCVVPTRGGGGKAPHGRWKRWQSEMMSEDRLRELMNFGGSQGIGAICGAISGGLVALDFDDREAFSEWCARCEAAGLSDLLEAACAGYLEETPRGAHVLVRVPTPGGNTKLAPKIETRGEGGFVVVAPSGGNVHESGKPYVLRRGGFGSILEMSDDELGLLLDVARSFAPQIDTTAEPPSWSQEDSGGRPGDEWARVTSWASILEPHGWKRVFVGSNGAAYWRRPGKAQGISATTNHAGSDLLYCFTTSTGFAANRGYGKFSAWALLEHDSDYAAAARALAAMGYGKPRVEAPDPEAGKAIADAFIKRRASTESVVGDTDAPLSDAGLNPPGVLGEIVSWINRTSVSPQPELAVAGAIAAVAACVGRRGAADENGLRPNLYLVGTAPSCAGKAHAPKCVTALLAALGHPRRAMGGRVTSGKAIYDQRRWEPSTVWMPDEFGMVLARFLRSKAGAELELREAILELTGAPGATWAYKTYARGKDDDQAPEPFVVHDPCVSIYATTTPSTLWGALSGQGGAASGLLGRFLPFVSSKGIPGLRKAKREDVPRSVVAALRPWMPTTQEVLSSMVGKESNRLATGAAPERAVCHVEASRAAVEAMDAYTNALLALRSKLLDDGHEDASTVIGRIHAHAWRLALVSACGRRPPGDARIELLDASWAIDVASWCARSLMRAVRDEVSESVTESNRQKIRAIIAAAGPDGAPKSQITRDAHRIPRREREDALADLVESGEVEAHKDGRATRFLLKC